VFNGLPPPPKEVGVIFRYQSYVSKSDALQLHLQAFDEHNQLPLVDIPSNNLPLVIKNVADIYFSITAVVLLFPVFIITAQRY
jgi:lipopolysaccharide/colanic/teichoic acid biosynthesis glycosyltransferase